MEYISAFDREVVFVVLIDFVAYYCSKLCIECFFQQTLMFSEFSVNLRIGSHQL